ncbi:hypothetical protein CH339_14900 [Rhodobium orientis]|uniref:Uncharacterized protein n=1 Tax=Rhodobium orientis TaxID=34017 RepID=A0A327JJQ0_9HYPH|nr:hypothetical protein CH339_14900 [Rhodobium orientis]
MMKLLFRRTQSSGKLGNIVFGLWGKVELDNDELAIIKRYRLDNAILIDAGQEHLVRNSALTGLLVFAIASIVLLTFATAKAALFFGFIVGGIAGYVYFHQKRETIFVRDLMHGRQFKCGSVVELARKEEWLGLVTAFLRQVMESAKHWGGTETRDIEALPKDEARRVIIAGL